MTLRSFILILFSLTLALPALALTSAERLILMSPHNSGNFSIPPVGSTLASVGDSRIQNSISYTFNGGTITAQSLLSNGYLGWFQLGSNNVYPPFDSYGVGSTTSLNLFDRVLGLTAPYTGASPDNYNGVATATSFTTVTSAGAETVAPYAGTGGISGGWVGFPGPLTRGSFTNPSWTTVTFGLPSTVNASCSTTSGGPYTYTPFSVANREGDVIPSGCISDAYGATKTYGGLATTRNINTVTPSGGAWANFVITQPASGVRAQSGDSFTLNTFGPSARSYSVVSRAADMNWNVGGSQVYSPLNGPQQAVLLVDSVNDTLGLPVSNATQIAATGSAYGACPGPVYATAYPTMAVVAPCLSMVSIAAILDAYKASGKIVFLSDEVPSGPKTSQMEQHTVTAGTCTITATNSPFFKDGSQWAATNGLGSLGQAVPGLIGTIGTATTIYQYTASAPAIGYYSVNTTTGVYTLNVNDPLCISTGAGGYAYLSYSYGASATGGQRAIMHAWLSSKAASFSFGGQPYNFPGALYNRPNIIPLQTWRASIDADPANWSGDYDTCLVDNCYAMSGVFDHLSLHPTIFGGNLFEAAVRKALATNPKLIGLPDNTQAPVYNNIQCAKSDGLTLTYSCIMPPSMLQTNHPPVTLAWLTNKVTENGLTFAAGSGLAVGSTVNYTTGAVTIKFTTAPPINTYFYLLEDTANLIYNNPMLEPVSGQAGGALCAGGTGLTTYPFGWSCYSTSGSAGLNIVYSYGTNPYTNVPSLIITISGVASTTYGGSLLISNSSLMPTPGNVYRGGLNVVIGPNAGHIFGLSYTSIKVAGAPTTSPDIMTNGAFYTINTAAGTVAPSSFTQMNALAGLVATQNGGLDNWSYSDAQLSIPGQNLGVSLPLITPVIDWKNNTGSSSNIATISVSWYQGPVNATIYVSQAQYRQRN